LSIKGDVMKLKLKLSLAVAALALSGLAQAVVPSTAVVREYAGSVLSPGPFTWTGPTVDATRAFNLSGTVTSAPFSFPSSLVPGGVVTLPALSLSSVTLNNADTGASWVDSDLSNGFSFSNMAIGHYFIEVKGTAGPVFGGVFGVVSVATAVPVPEADAAVLAIVGMAAAGVAVRRRRQA